MKYCPSGKTRLINACGSLNCSFIMTYVMLTTFIVAANIIKAELREKYYRFDVYPSNEDISSISKGKEWLPQSLEQLLKLLIPSYEIKQVSIGHCILQAVRPRSVIPPVPFGLGVDADHAFGSKWLVDQLARLGFSISSDEVRRYKQSVVEDQGNIVPEYTPGAFVQWIAENVDHNIATLDVKGTFHGMGLVSAVTPGNVANKLHVIKRLKERRYAADVVKGKGVQIFPYTGPLKSGRLNFDPYITLNMAYVLPSELSYDMLWHSAALFSSMDKPRPSWSGFMQHATSDRSYSRSDVFLLPIIDLQASDESCNLQL